jgi:hypothetical protein
MRNLASLTEGDLDQLGQRLFVQSIAAPLFHDA